MSQQPVVSRYQEAIAMKMRTLLLLTLVSIGSPTSLAQTAGQDESSGVLGPRFDHFTTGFELDGTHQTVACSSCHTNSIFAGTPSTCVGCHSGAGFVRASRKHATHNTTTDRCSSCHGTNSWSPVVRVDHLETLGTCAGCHNNLRVSGKPPSHLPTNADCASCHRSSFWSMATFSHDGITTNCVACHNGTTATGKVATHIPATNQCESCHNTRAFSMVFSVDHQAVLGNCSSCHNNQIASGQPPDHLPTSAECDSCHNTRGWR